ncbi:MAG: hypothetical protein K2M75_01840 [Clostridia bacterium]|nr:hypothetical protein [Clostridia bacterium]
MLPLERLLDILDENKVKYPKKFKNIEINGYDSNRCENFSQEIREDIQWLLAKGINNGFDSNIKTAIYELADMACDMSKDKIVLKLDDMQDRKQQIIKKFRLDKGEDNMADIKGEIIAYIDNSIMGANMLINGDSISDYNKSILMNSVEMLEELRFIVEEAMDNSSEDAAHRAKYVYGDPTYALCAWRESVARGMIFDGLNKHLYEARDEAVKWTELTQEVSKRKRAKDADIKVYSDDMFSKMVKRDEVKEKGDAFFAKLNAFEKQFEIQKDTYDKVSEINSSIEEIQGKIAALIDKMDNGEILEEEALLQIEMLEEDEELKKTERETYRASLKMIAGTVSAMKRLLTQFKRLELIFNMYQRVEPNMFYAMFSNIDFNTFLDVLSYGASETQIITALSYYEIVMENVQEQTMHMAQVDNRFAEANKLFDAFKTPSRRTQNNNDAEKEEQAKKDKIAELRKKYKKPAPAIDKQDKQDKEEQREDDGDKDDLSQIIATITPKK